MGKYSTPKEHQDVFELLPWKANGCLSVDDQDRVNAHIHSCNLCQYEIQNLHKIYDCINSSNTHQPQRVELNWKKLAQRIKRVEGNNMN